MRTRTQHLRRASAAALALGLLLAPAAHAVPPPTESSGTIPPPSAEPAPVATEAPPPPPPPSPPPAKLTILPRPVPSPLHPRLRPASSMTMGLGVYCPNFGTPSLPYGRWCAAQLHLGLDNAFGNVHLVGLIGDVLRGGIKLGFELGSRFLQLGPRQSRAALAIRGNFDFLVAKLGEPVPGRADDGVLGFSNTYGPHFSIALSPQSSVEVRAAVGWAVAGFFDHAGVDRPAYGLVCEGWLGMRFQP